MIAIDLFFQKLTFDCPSCNEPVVTGFKDIWEADPDTMGDISIRCFQCDHLTPIQIIYHPVYSQALWPAPKAARFVNRVNKRRKLIFSSFAEQAMKHPTIRDGRKE